MSEDLSQYDPYRPLQIDSLPTALYVHVPFCLRRCGYCDFTLVAENDTLIPAWLEALGNEINRLDRSFTVDTVFVGGGTPTHLNVSELQQLFEVVGSKFDWTASSEVSIEANPDGLDNDRLKALKDLGVNRISLGVQSFDDDVLKFLERQHTTAEAIDSVTRACEFFDNVSLDLIFGVPGQTLQSWQQSLVQAVTLPIRHLSTYGLTYEKGTSFYSRRLHGRLCPVPDELERQMYAEVIDYTAANRFRHYEVSNFARWDDLERDDRCRHNLTYWEAKPYFAFGPGAARYLEGVRSTNDRNVVRWVNKWKKNQLALQDVEQLDPEARAREGIFLGLRQISGFDERQFAAEFGFTVESLSSDALKKHLTAGLLQRENGRLALTGEGLFLADSVISDFLVP